MLHDAARVLQAETGEPPSWAETNAHFRDLTLREWRLKPAWAIQLAARKGYWFFTGRNWSDNCQPTDEIACGLAAWMSRLAPVPTPWIIGLGLVGLALMLRHPIRHAPEWLLVAIPLLVVMLFWYSPRFRLPAVPILTVAAAWTIVRAVRVRQHWPVSIVAILALAVSIGLGPLNQHYEFDRRIRWMVAMKLADKGDFATAESELRQTLKENPGLANAVSALAYVKHKKGDNEEAIKLYEQAIALDRDNPNLRILYGVLLTKLHRWDKAVDVLVSALQARPELYHARQALDLALSDVRENGRLEDTIQAFARICATDVATPEVRAEYGAFLVDAQRWQDAIEQLSAVLVDRPNSVVAHCNLGVALGSLGRLDDSHRHLQRAVELAPGNHKMWYGLGVLYVRQGNYAEAENCFRRALSIDPTYQKARDALEHLQGTKTQR
jgi:Tfp pilus assembly protein PilF